MRNKARAYHIGCPPGSVGRYGLLPGDPGRCAKIAQFFEQPVKVAENREFVTYTGFLQGEKVSVTSTGIGGPSAAIAMEELAALGMDTFIRVGTCGGLPLHVKSGDLILPNGAVRQEGTSLEYAPIAFPAVPDYTVLTALVQAAQKQNQTWHVGVVQSKDSFYGQHEPERMPVSHQLLSQWEAWKRLHVLGSEMETAALFTVAASLGKRCGSVLRVVWNQERDAAGLPDQESSRGKEILEVGIAALKILISADQSK